MRSDQIRENKIVKHMERKTQLDLQMYTTESDYLRYMNTDVDDPMW